MVSETPSLASATSKQIARSNHFSTSPVMTIVVGTEKKHYHVHVDLLKAKSDYFRASMNSCFIESQTNVTDLTDINPQYFDHVVDWLYGVKIEDIFETLTRKTRFTIELYQLADRFIMPKLKNDIVDSYCDLCKSRTSVPSPTWIIKLCDRGLLHSKLGKLFVELFARDLVQNRTRWQKPAMNGLNKEQAKRYKTLRDLCDHPEITAEIMKCIVEQQGSRWRHLHSGELFDFYEDVVM